MPFSYQMIEYLILKEKKRKKIEHLTVLREIMLLLFEYTILFWEFFVQSFLRGLYIARIDLFCWQKPLVREREEDKKKKGLATYMSYCAAIYCQNWW